MLGLVPTDYAALASATGLLAEVLARRLQLASTQEFKLPELRAILKYLRSHPSFASNPYNHKQHTGSLSVGKKSALADALKNILSFQISTAGGNSPAPPAAAPAPAAAAAATSDPQPQPSYQQQAVMQQQYRNMQAQQAAQQAAAQQGRYPQTDPYAHYAQANPASRPAGYPPGVINYAQQQQLAQQQLAQQQAQQIAARQAQAQQYAYVNGAYAQQPMQQPMQQQRAAAYGMGIPAANGYPQHPQHQHPQQQQHHSAPAPPAAAAPPPPPPPPSHPALNAASKVHEINALCALPAMSAQRSPYECVQASLAKNLLNAQSHTGANNVGGSAAYHTQLQFNLAPNYLARLKRANRKQPEGQELEVHLRLFCSLPPTPGHTAWDKRFRVVINGHEIHIPDARKLSKSKKKGLDLVRGLDVSEYCTAANTVEVSVYRQNYTTEMWRGLVMADLISIRDTSELMDIQEKIKKEQESKKQATALQRSCVICHSTKDPLRCSRCKSEWYCCAEHQRSHWPTHREKCVAPTPAQDAEREAIERKAAQEAMLGPNGRTRLVMPVKVKGEAGASGHDSDDEAVQEVDSLVSLKCPLSLERYVFPARGKNCGHLPCFNLETFLQFSQQSGVWQCPVCYKPLPWEDIEVDLNMLSVIRETTEGDVSQIRVHPDGQYDVISNVPEGESGDGREPVRKRKLPSSSPTNVPPQQNQAKTQAVGATAPTRAATAEGDQSPGWVDTSFLIDPAAPPAAAAAASSAAAAAAGAGAASPRPGAVSASPAAAGVGTADEPIELD